MRKKNCLPGFLLALATACGGHPSWADRPNATDDSTDESGGTSAESSEGQLTTTEPEEQCGDGEVDPDEECDDGNTWNQDGCDADCQVESNTTGVLTTTTSDTTGPGQPCGNGELDPDEECDDGINDGSYGTCNADCTQAPSCGDEEINGPEVCDGDTVESTCEAQGFDGGFLQCPPAQCLYFDTSGCYKCGDGVINGQEECDDDNDVDTDTCTNACTKAICGDGIVQTDVEKCDDGDQDDLNACNTSCTLCGNGVVDPGEGCDDGNLDNADACIHDGADNCFPKTCGDGVKQRDELCDDGNQTEEPCDHNCAPN